MWIIGSESLPSVEKFHEMTLLLQRNTRHISVKVVVGHSDDIFQSAFGYERSQEVPGAYDAVSGDTEARFAHVISQNTGSYTE